jgi:hypothetical protein
MEDSVEKNGFLGGFRHLRKRHGLAISRIMDKPVASQNLSLLRRITYDDR